jgi:uncharacterized membrane protein
MTYALAYVVCLLIFAAVDVTWLMTMGARLYKQTLGDILLANVNFAPAVAFYLIYPAGLVIFAVIPSLKADSIAHAFVYGALFGFFAYATYELTNYATLRNWTLQLTVVDIAYGAIASGAVAAATAFVVGWWRGGV